MRIPALGLVAALAVAWTPPGAAASPPPTPTLTLDDLVALALATSPALRAADARADALAGAAEQADTLPNPEFGIQAENAAGSGPYRGAKALETTYSLTQTIEMGGKRGWRRDTAAAAAHRGALDRDAVRLDLARDVRLAAIAVLAAHERRQIVEEQRALADETRRAVAGRVQAGRDSPMREDRAGLALTQATVDAARARRDEDAAGHALSLLIDRPVAAAQLDTAALHLLAADGAAEAGGDVPDLARWRAELARARAAVGVERAKAVPDVKIGAGIRRFNDGGDTAAVVGLTIPIPAFDTNRGNIRRARAEALEAEMEMERAGREHDTALAIARDRLATARAEARTLAETVVPGAERTGALAQEGYRQGKFPYLDVLDAQRTLLDARLGLTTALRDYQESRIALDRLRGAAPLSEDMP